MIDQYAYTGIYLQRGSTWLTGTPMDFPDVFDKADVGWEFWQANDQDQQTGQALMEAASPKDAVVIVKIFPTYEAREEWFRSAYPRGFV